MKLEDLLKAVIDGNYPKGFMFFEGMCENVDRLCYQKDRRRFRMAIRALYRNNSFPVAGWSEFRRSKYSGNMYQSGYRALFCKRVLHYLHSPWYKRIFTYKRVTEIDTEQYYENEIRRLAKYYHRR